MKKNLLYPMMALFMTLFATSCSQEEILSDSDKWKMVTMNVNIPINKAGETRAIPSVEGHKLRCIMQVVNAETGAVIEGEEYKKTVEATEANLTYTFTEPDVNYNIIFWADYVKSDADITTDHIYSTTDLKAIGYVKKDNTLFNNEAADAFCGKALKGENSITLRRPFAKINIKPAQDVADQFTGYDKITATYKTPSGYNIMTGEITNWEEVEYAEGTITSDGKWFEAFVFAANNTASLDDNKGNKIAITLTKSADQSTKKVEVAGADVKAGENINANINVTPTASGKATVVITIDNGYIRNDDLKVGRYVYADGTFGVDPANAIAIVWKVVEDGGVAVGDKTSNYTAENNMKITVEGDNYQSSNGNDLNGKIIAGYAFAIDFVNRIYIGPDMNNYDKTVSKNIEDINNSNYASITKSRTIIECLSYDAMLIKNYAEFCINKNITGNNLSNWYIPSYKQAEDFSTMLIGFEDTAPNTEVAAAFSNAGGKFNGTRGYEPSWHMTTDITADNTCATIDAGEKSGTSHIFKKGNTQVFKAGSQFAFRPVITIFKDAVQ